MKIKETIKQARIAAGLNDVELAHRLGKTITEYMDIEFYENELASVEDLHVVRQLCQILHIDPFDLFGISKENPYVDQKRNELIISQMKKLKMTNEELADQIGFKVVAIEEMRANPNFLENWTVDLIRALAEALRLPLQSLLRF